MSKLPNGALAAAEAAHLEPMSISSRILLWFLAGMYVRMYLKRTLEICDHDATITMNQQHGRIQQRATVVEFDLRQSFFWSNPMPQTAPAGREAALES